GPQFRENRMDFVPRYAIKTPPHHATWPEFLTFWQAADEIDVFESAWNWDHFYPLAPPYDGPNLEGWTMLGALAQATSRIRIGAMVNGMHHRHPAVTANMAATLDHLSNGRFELGMGAGWNFMESDAYGIPLGTKKERSDRFEEGMEVIVSLLNNTTTSFEGEYYQLTDAWCEPKPVQAKLPIVIGGKGRQRTLRTVARFADQWDMTFPETPEEWTELNEVLKEHCEAVGRDESEITRSAHLMCDPDVENSALAEQAHGFFEAGLDIVVWSMRGDVDPSRLEPLANALSS
ncbi:MAG: TIGR03560 family F420-dependent LLM class oxidoreductase, partial [Acidimicrobiales bacterium]